jgi:hypothetical protein
MQQKLAQGQDGSCAEKGLVEKIDHDIFWAKKNVKIIKQILKLVIVARVLATSPSCPYEPCRSGCQSRANTIQGRSQTNAEESGSSSDSIRSHS